MQGFMEVQSISDGSTMSVSIRHITAIVSTDYGTFIEMGMDGKGRSVGVPVADSYEEIKQKISNTR